MPTLDQEFRPSETAVVVIEFQKTWTQGGIFAWLIRRNYRSRKVLANTRRLLDFARQRGVAVFQAPFIVDPSCRHTYRRLPWLPRLLKGFTAGTWKSEFTPGIYHPSDVVIKGRYGFDACRGSNLLSTLRQSGINLIIFCGFTTDQCVARTMKSLSREGFRCFLASDASATIFRRQQKRVEARFPSLPVAELIRWMSRSG